MTVCARIAIDSRAAQIWAAQNQSKIVWTVNNRTAYEIDDSGFSVLTIVNDGAHVSAIGRTERDADARALNAIHKMNADLMEIEK